MSACHLYLCILAELDYYTVDYIFLFLFIWVLLPVKAILNQSHIYQFFTIIIELKHNKMHTWSVCIAVCTTKWCVLTFFPIVLIMNDCRLISLTWANSYITTALVFTNLCVYYFLVSRPKLRRVHHIITAAQFCNSRKRLSYWMFDRESATLSSAFTWTRTRVSEKGSLIVVKAFTAKYF